MPRSGIEPDYSIKVPKNLFQKKMKWVQKEFEQNKINDIMIAADLEIG